MKKRTMPILSAIVQDLNMFNSLKGLSREEVHKYVMQLKGVLNQASKTAYEDEVRREIQEASKNLADVALKIPLEKTHASAFALYSPLFDHALNSKSPILAIDNPELIQMLLDTDVAREMLINVKLPFDEMIVCFEYTGYLFEAVISKVTLDPSYMFTGNTPLEDGSTFFAAQAFMMKHIGGKRIISEMYDINVSNINSSFDVINEGLSAQAIKAIEDGAKIFKSLFLYLSLQRTVEYIKKATSQKLIKKSIGDFKKNKTPAYLFSDVRYVYDSPRSTNGTANKPHLVRGHFRNQQIGSRTIQIKDYKTIWIEPYYTGTSLPTKSNIRRLN